MLFSEDELNELYLPVCNLTVMAHQHTELSHQTYFCVCLIVLCLWQVMDTTSCLEPWLLSKVTVHRLEVRVLWATIDTKPFFTFSLKTHTHTFSV